MSILPTLTKRLESLEDTYNELLQKCEESILLDGVTLKNALKSQLQLQMDWEIITKQIAHLHDTVENEMESIYAEAISKELKDSYRSSSISEAKEFAKTNKEYKEIRRLYVDVKRLRDESRGVLDTINSRKYLLNNMTNSIVASVDDTIL
jgi:esterase/lipase